MRETLQRIGQKCKVCFHLVQLCNVNSLSLNLHGSDNLVLGVDIAVQNVTDLIPAGLDGGADAVNLLETGLVCWWRGHKILLIWEPPKKCR